MRHLRRIWWLCGVAALYGSAAHAQEVASAPPAPLCTIQDKRINELSGLAASRAYPGCLWAHNDSGDTARIFLLNPKGATVAVVNLSGATAHDWEDIDFAGKYIYIGDIGDNAVARDSVQVYRLREPKLNPEKLDQEITVSPTNYEAMTLHYPDGPRDAETLAVTPKGQLLIVSKSLTGSNFYTLPTRFKNGGIATLQKIASDFHFGAMGFLTRLATAGDFSPDGHKLAICTYAQLYEWTLTQPFDVSTLHLDAAQICDLPPIHQGEGLCYSLDGKHLFFSGEGLNQPIYEVASQLP